MSRPDGSQFIEELRQRNLVAQISDEEGLTKLLTAGVVPVYAGYDPTASSLHVGNLVPTILLKRFQLAGHRPIIVVGGATGMIGDPSGKSDERNLLDPETLAANVAGIRAQLSTLLDFDDPHTGAVMTNNVDWTQGVSFLEFLRDYGKHLTINYMMAKDSVKTRLEGDSGISYTEFSYMLLQAFDFVHLAKTHGVRLQVGGSDQYGNITAGCELSRKMGGVQLFGLTAPLLLDSSGQKMGKSASGERIWLDANRTTPYAYYQYWLNRPDDEVPRLLKLFSLRPLAELDAVLAEHDADRSKRIGQRELARAMTSWVHGDASIATVEAASRVMFGGSLEGITEDVLAQLAGTIPTVDIPRAEFEAGIGIVDLLARTVADSKGAARRLVQQGGAYVNNIKIGDVEHKVTLAHLATPTMLVVRGGKKDYRIVRVR
ncbi:MAG: tyrosine--tRNA ligase [Kofleriaceae bacterium]|nr:tyrosine--tRNA ligase [Kofleriaceae bacterium]